MANTTIVLNQLQHLLPLSEFQSFVGQLKADRYVKRLTCRNQLSILLYAQATEKRSLRDIQTSLTIRDSTWYHLGLETAARSTLAKANEKRPFQIYESLFYNVSVSLGMPEHDDIDALAQFVTAYDERHILGTTASISAASRNAIHLMINGEDMTRMLTAEQLIEAIDPRLQKKLDLR